MEQYAEATVASIVYDDESPCRMCGKRQSPSSSHLGISSNTCDAEPRTKKPMLHNHHPLPGYDSGYTEIKLPIDFNTAMNLTPMTSDSPFLRRCVSDPYNSPGDGNKNNNAGSIEPDGPLRRCISDPSHPPGTMEKNQMVGHASTNSPARGMSPGGGLPPLYPGSNRPSTELTPPKVPPTDYLTGQSPDSLRLKRMRQRMKEMSQWWVDVVHEDDDEENHNAAAAPASQDASDKELEEQVSVEKIGDDGLKIKLRCPCGSGYELLISGHCCYYKIL